MSKQKLTYISLFSGAGVGCYGFSLEGFECVATNEIIERRLNVQKHNNKCKYNTGYIQGDARDEKVKERLYEEIKKWRTKEKNSDIDVILATPPCQGISVANHKKKDEKSRNSLIVESIKLVNDIKPKFFVFENIRMFMNAVCTDVDGQDKKIEEAIYDNLEKNYNITSRVINFKNYGNNSSRTRTLVMGARKDLAGVTPYDLFPKYRKEKTLKDVIGHLPKLDNMGEISSNDIYHGFRSYSPHMMEWIKDTKEGESAFDNKDPKKRPHRVVNGEVVYNKNKNGDKYKRCEWDKIGPCIHTRNDILASQATIHPNDNRVFSIRELMLMMTIPNSFKWVDESFDKINSLPEKEKRKILNKEEINIRQSIGEAVPTEILRQIAENIKDKLLKDRVSVAEVKKIIKQNDLTNYEKIIKFIEKNKKVFSISNILKIAELANSKRQDHAAYYTRQDICFSLVNELPEFKNKSEINILEPSVGLGNFLPLLFEKYQKAKKVNIDLIDIDEDSIKILKKILKIIRAPQNFHIKFINDDFLLKKNQKRYDIVIGNPPFGKITKSKTLLSEYKKNKTNYKTNNIFSFFVEKSLKTGTTIALISPKSLLSAPDFNLTRKLLSQYQFQTILDYGEKAFNGVKIETIGFVLNKKTAGNNRVKIASYINNTIRFPKQNYIFDKNLPVWIIYRNKNFDNILNKLKLDIFNVYRDRCITKRYINGKKEIRVLKSRNIDNNKIVDIPNYDCYLDHHTAVKLTVSKFMNEKSCVLVPNLTYNPRACFLPDNAIADGSVAILTPKNGDKITKKDLEYFSTEEFKYFYLTAKNFGTRSLNIDSNFVYFFGIKK